MTNCNIAEIRGVTKRYGPVTALDNIDLNIRAGEVVALLGPNGAGKTTAVSLLLGLMRPTQGSVTVFDGDPGVRSVRMHIGAMLQVARVPATLKVREHIALFSSYYRHPMPMEECIATAGFEGLEDRLFDKLSGGQKQRVLFALAICGNPDLLFLDEPTASLDVEARRMLWKQIRRFAALGSGVLLTTHDLSEADALASRIVVIHRGSVVAEGTPEQIKSRAAGKKIRCTTSLHANQIQSMSGVVCVSLDRNRVEILTASPEAIIPRLLALDPGLRDLEVVGAGLEEAFLALTKEAA